MVAKAAHGESFGDIILHHVTNDLSHKYLELHLFGIDMSITKHVIMLWITAFVVILLGLWATAPFRKSREYNPNRLSTLFEFLMDFIRNDIVAPNIGKDAGRGWVPLITTYFLFILSANILGMLPIFDKLPGGSNTVTGNFAATLALASITFIAIILAGSKKHGFIQHWKNMVPHGVPGPVLFILIPIEIIGMIVKPVALTLRLGANMTAGHIGLVAIFGLPFLLNNSGIGAGTSFAVGFVSVALNTGIYMLEIIVSLVQAYVFTLLSAVFIGMAIHPEH